MTTETRHDTLEPASRHDIDPFAGPGEHRTLCRAVDWAATPLGPVSRWPRSLRVAVRTALGSAFPSVVCWGPQLAMVYNDAYAALIGGRHPRALGMPTHACWPETRAFHEPIYARVLAGETVHLEDALLRTTRHGLADDGYFTLSYGPIPDDAGEVGGVLVTLVETTGAVRHRQAEAERERLAAAVRTAERRAARILEQVSDAHATLDHAFRFQTVNPAAERALGKSARDMLGRSHWEVFPASRGSRVEREYRRVQAERVEAHFTHHYVDEEYDVHLEIAAYPTDDGGVAIFWRDVSERVRAERALQDSEARYRALSESVPVQVWTARADGHLDFVSAQAAAYFGVTDAELLRGPWHQFVHPDDRDTAIVRWAAAIARGEPYEVEFRLRRADGTYHWHLGRATPQRDASGAIVGWVGSNTDVENERRARRGAEAAAAALRTSEEAARERLAELEAIYDSAPVGLCVLDLDRRYRRINERLAEINGVPAAAHLGRTVREVVPGIADVAEALFDRIIATGEPALDVAIVGETPAQPGVTRAWIEQWLPIRDAAGRVTGISVVAEEVTAQRAAAAERERLLAAEQAARAEAEAANRAKGEFLAVMSHELRTPLNAIGGYAELLELGVRGPVTEPQRQDLARIQQSQRHLLGLINQVLNYTRVETGTVRYDLTVVPVATALTVAETLVLPQVRARGLRFETSDGDPALAVVADAEKLRQILLNLLTNAIKFTEPGGRIAVSCDATGDAVTITVADTGIGIEPDKLETIFEPFVQVDSRLSRRQEGVGLGLAISRDLARGMGGELTATSRVGEGSEFRVVMRRATVGEGREGGERAESS